MSALSALPVTGLKLVARFVADLDDESSTAPLAAGLAGLVAGLGLDGVAEGVETARQAAALRAMGWQRAQGFTSAGHSR